MMTPPSDRCGHTSSPLICALFGVGPGKGARTQVTPRRLAHPPCSPPDAAPPPRSTASSLDGFSADRRWAEQGLRGAERRRPLAAASRPERLPELALAAVAEDLARRLHARGDDAGDA